MTMNKNLYRKLVLKLIRHSNVLAIFMILVAIFVCFSPYIWLYVAIVGISSVYLGWLTCQYIASEEDNCNSSCNLQYGCQVASFNSRLSIVSNVSVALFGIALSCLTAYYIINSKDSRILGPSELINIPYVIGFFKLMLMYILSDKIHTLQLFISILYRYSQSIRFLNIDYDTKHPEFRYPRIFLDQSCISDQRYRVTGFSKGVNVVFNPVLSIGDDSTIEYSFIREDENHRVHSEPLYDKYDQPSCFFRCHVIIKNKE